MPHRFPFGPRALTLTALALAAALAGCMTPERARRQADKAGTRIAEQARREQAGRTETFTIDRPDNRLRDRLMVGQDLPGTVTSTNITPIRAPLCLNLEQALQAGAYNDYQYQALKEALFSAALDLDLEEYAFRNSYAGILSGGYTDDRSGDEPVRGYSGNATAGIARKLQNGATLGGKLGLDLVKLLTGGGGSSLGVFFDPSISIPLLRGAGRDIVTAPMTQARQNVGYAVFAFEVYKQKYAVNVAGAYFNVIEQQQQAANAFDARQRLASNRLRAARMSEAGRMSGIQVDQARQDELRAEQGLIAARLTVDRGLDDLKTTLGLPADARIVVDTNELARLNRFAAEVSGGATNAGPAAREIGGEVGDSVRIALARRYDLMTARGRVVDAERNLRVAADQLRADLKLTGKAHIGSGRTLSTVGQDNASLDAGSGVYGAGFEADLPWDRTAERNAYRKSQIVLEQARRTLQTDEDGVKTAVRAAHRNLWAARDSCAIQARALELAQCRVTSAQLFLQAGRLEMRDLLDAQDALLSAQNDYIVAVVGYRLSGLQLRREMGVLEVSENGLWKEGTDEGQP